MKINKPLVTGILITIILAMALSYKPKNIEYAGFSKLDGT